MVLLVHKCNVLCISMLNIAWNMHWLHLNISIIWIWMRQALCKLELLDSWILCIRCLMLVPTGRFWGRFCCYWNVVMGEWAPLRRSGCLLLLEHSYGSVTVLTEEWGVIVLVEESPFAVIKHGQDSGWRSLGARGMKTWIFPWLESAGWLYRINRRAVATGISQ